MPERWPFPSAGSAQTGARRREKFYLSINFPNLCTGMASSPWGFCFFLFIRCFVFNKGEGTHFHVTQWRRISAARQNTGSMEAGSRVRSCNDAEGPTALLVPPPSIRHRDWGEIPSKKTSGLSCLMQIGAGARRSPFAKTVLPGRRVRRRGLNELRFGVKAWRKTINGVYVSWRCDDGACWNGSSDGCASLPVNRNISWKH